MASGRTNTASREARERARVYEARKALHEAQKRRRTRDNVIASIAVGLVVAGAVAAQAVYYTAGPGAPEPDPTSTPAPSVEPTPPALPPAP